MIIGCSATIHCSTSSRLQSVPGLAATGATFRDSIQGLVHSCFLSLAGYNGAGERFFWDRSQLHTLEPKLKYLYPLLSARDPEFLPCFSAAKDQYETCTKRQIPAQARQVAASDLAAIRVCGHRVQTGPDRVSGTLDRLLKSLSGERAICTYIPRNLLGRLSPLRRVQICLEPLTYFPRYLQVLI